MFRFGIRNFHFFARLLIIPQILCLHVWFIQSSRVRVYVFITLCKLLLGLYSPLVSYCLREFFGQLTIYFSNSLLFFNEFYRWGIISYIGFQLLKLEKEILLKFSLFLCSMGKGRYSWCTIIFELVNSEFCYTLVCQLLELLKSSPIFGEIVLPQVHV